MATLEFLTIRRGDYERICALLESAKPDIAELLDEELERAHIVPDDELPYGVVAMNSRIQFVDIDSGYETALTLVYPDQADVSQNRVSILAPIGAALIGLHIGQTINWPLPNGKLKRIQVVAVEAEQQFSRAR